ncbi:MAG: beta strand repeat-containing protein [Phycisphaerales bacterium JB050]
MNRACVIALASGLAVSVAVGAGEINWASPVDGMWNSAPNWSPAMVPSGVNDVAVLGLSDPYTVEMNINSTISGVEISYPNAILASDAGRTHSLATDGLFNDGWLIVNDSAVNAVTTISFNESSTLNGSGLITLNYFGSRAQIISSTDALLTHGVNHTINGQGEISLRFDNQGWIVADMPAQTLTIRSGDKINTGVLSAIDEGILSISSTSIDQTGGGIIEANGGTVVFSNSTITGGTLLNTGTPSSLISLNANTLDAVSISGDSQLNAGFTTTITGGSLSNDSVLTVNPTAVNAVTTLAFTEPTVISGGGAIRLGNFQSRARMIGSGISVENSADHSILGYGQIRVDLVNSGQVSADIAGQALEVRDGNMTNLSTMRAQSGGTLLVIATTVEQSEHAELLADGGTVDLSSATINNGRLINSGTDGSAGVLSSTTTLNDVTIEGQWDLKAGVSATLQGVTDGSGTILVNPDSVNAITTLSVTEDAELAGSGAIRLNNFASRARIISDSEAVLTQGPDRAIFGFGQIAAGFVNNGLVQADVDGQVILFDNQAKVNNSNFRAVDGGGLQFQGVSVDQTAGGTIEADGGEVTMSGTTVIGGTLRNTGSAGSSIAISTATVDSGAIEGEVVLNAGGNMNLTGNGLVLSGILLVNPNGVNSITTLTADGMNLISGSGEIRLGTFASRARILNSTGDLLTLGSGQTLSGIGQIAAETQLNGALSPGLSIGTMHASRPVHLGDTSTCVYEFNGIDGSDHLDSTSSVSLNGTLDISFVDGFDPTSPAAFEIMTTGTNGITGRFDQVTGDSPDLPLITRVVYEPTRVRVGFVCPSDANLDGATDLGDLNAVLANFGTNASLGDVTGDGAVDLADLNMVLANFGTDCMD